MLSGSRGLPALLRLLQRRVRGQGGARDPRPLGGRLPRRNGLGLGLVLVRLTSGWTLAPLRWFAIFFVEVFRRVPFLVTLMLVFFAFQLTGADVPLFAVAAASVCLIACAFLSEIIRAGSNRSTVTNGTPRRQ